MNSARRTSNGALRPYYPPPSYFRQSVHVVFWPVASFRGDVSFAKTDEDKQGLLDLAGIWTQAALLARNGLGRSQLRG